MPAVVTATTMSSSFVVHVFAASLRSAHGHSSICNKKKNAKENRSFLCSSSIKNILSNKILIT